MIYHATEYEQFLIIQYIICNNILLFESDKFKWCSFLCNLSKICLLFYIILNCSSVKSGAWWVTVLQSKKKTNLGLTDPPSPVTLPCIETHSHNFRSCGNTRNSILYDIYMKIGIFIACIG